MSPARTFVVLCLCWLARAAAAISASAAEPDWLSGDVAWKASAPLVAPAEREGETCVSVKDPTVVFHDGRWHLFCTIRGQPRTHRIEYMSFADWEHTADAKRTVLELSDGYFCAPQVFWFQPHRKWYLLYQASDESRTPSLQPVWSASDKIDDARGWTPPALLFDEQPDNVAMWIDFWVICDERHAHLFFTSLDGRMWRSQTPLAEFPGGWGRPEVALEADIFEASHTYRLAGRDEYLTVVEAQAGGRRYYKAYLADKLAGPWRPVADEWERPFAGRENVRFDGHRWADSISHGELLRAGIDQRLEIDPANLRFLFQGVTDEAMSGKPYGEIPWRLGLLEPTAP